jgi:hypothetical protein
MKGTKALGDAANTASSDKPTMYLTCVGYQDCQQKSFVRSTARSKFVIKFHKLYEIE